MCSMKQQRGVPVDAYIPDAEEERAGRLTVALDAKQLARLIVLADDRVEARVFSAHLEAGVSAGHRRCSEHQQHNGAGISHNALFLRLSREQNRKALSAPAAVV